MTEDDLSPWMKEFLEHEIKELDELVSFSDRLPAAKFKPPNKYTFYVDFRRPFLKWMILRNGRTQRYVLIPLYYEHKWYKFWIRDEHPFYRTLILEYLKKRRKIFTIQVKFDAPFGLGYNLEDNPEKLDMKKVVPTAFP